MWGGASPAAHPWRTDPKHYGDGPLAGSGGPGETHGDNHPMRMSPVAAVLTRVHCLQQDGQRQEWGTKGSFRGVAAPKFFLP